MVKELVALPIHEVLLLKSSLIPSFHSFGFVLARNYSSVAIRFFFS
jgi:hypothetical protein